MTKIISTLAYLVLIAVFIIIGMFGFNTQFFLFVVKTYSPVTIMLGIGVFMLMAWGCIEMIRKL